MLEGKIDLVLEGHDFVATAGDVIRLPMNIPHGLFNKSDQTREVFLLGVADPQALRSVLGHPQHERANPPDVVALSARHEVMFLPPPA